MKNFKQFIKVAKEKNERNGRIDVTGMVKIGYKIGVAAAAAAMGCGSDDNVLDLINTLSGAEMRLVRGCAIDTAKKYFGGERANLMFAKTSKTEFTYNLIKLYATLFEKNEKFFNAV